MKRAAMLLIAMIFAFVVVLRATAETLNFKNFNHVTKQEWVLIADVEGHIIGASMFVQIAIRSGRAHFSCRSYE